MADLDEIGGLPVSCMNRDLWNRQSISIHICSAQWIPLSDPLPSSLCVCVLWLKVVLRELLDGGMLHGDCLTVTGKTLAENISSAPRLSELKQVQVICSKCN